MNKLWLVVVLLALLNLPTLQFTPTFCSVTCGKITCLINDTTPNGCTACNTGWVLTGNTCNPNNFTNYYVFDKTNDLNGGLVVSPNNSASTTCTGRYGSVGYSVYGWINSGTSNIMMVGSATGITKTFYLMIVYFGIISLDACQNGCGGKNYWSDTTSYFLDFLGGDGFGQSNKYSRLGSTKAATGDYCSTSVTEKWNKFTQSYTYFTSNVSLDWSIYNNQPNTTTKWGLKQFIVIYRGCNLLCMTCYGPAVSQCYSCFYDSVTNTSWLSGTTCNQTCLPQYGYSTNISFCILCDPYCKTCYDSSTFCMTCTTSGQYTAYLYIDLTTYPINSTCLPVCPVGYFANKTTQTCDPCNVNCSACIYTANYCMACITNFYWYKYTCYDICPTKTYLESNLTNCTDCYQYCQVCIGPSTACTECSIVLPYIGYLYNTTNTTGTCVTACPQGYYAQNYNLTGPNLCLPCNASCFYCTGNPYPCQQCVADYYLYNQICYNPCPTGLFASNASGTGQCLDCNIVCVDLSISMYFSNALNNQVYIDMMFSQSLDFSNFDYKNFQTITISSQNVQYTIDMFNVTYKLISGTTYRIILKPLGYIFLYNATFTVTTRPQTNTTDYSLIMMPFKTTNYLKSASLSWFLIQGPPYSAIEVNIMTSAAALSQKTLNFLDLPGVQQLKKTGIFLLLFSGAQITSCSVLSNQVQSQNLYEGVRLWATFVFFDVPPYQRISNQTKYFLKPSVQSQIRDAEQISTYDQFGQKQRKLFSTDVMYWRFQRTGQTSFFIYDCYVPLFLIVLCWVGVFILHKCKKSRWFAKHAPKVYSAVHKIHEISILYVTMASIVEFIYFEPTSAERFISAIICVIFNIYFILYQLYIYHDMLKYPLAEIGNPYYNYYVYRYGCFLKNIRYEQYDIHQSWSPSHWFRPYNFHFLSYYKKFVMMITLPLFYSTEYAQMGVLFGIQLLQVFRVWIVWPFVSQRRNYLRISLQIALLLFFFFHLLQIHFLTIIAQSNINDMGNTINVFYGLGWAGFALCFYFNLTHVILCVYDFITGLKKSSRTMMDQARKQYYYQKIKSYEKDNEGASKQLVNKWVKLGNLNNQFYGELPQINVRIEEYQMRTILGKFEVTVRKITELRMMKKRNHKVKNNTVTTKKIEKKGVLAEHKNKRLYDILHGYYSTVSSNHIEAVILKTFINVFQPDFSQEEYIPFDHGKMFQKVQLISFDNEKQQKELPEMLEGFPLPRQLFEDF